MDFLARAKGLSGGSGVAGAGALAIAPLAVAVTAQEAEASAVTILEFGSGGLITPSGGFGDFSISSNTLAVTQQPVLNDIIGVKLAGSISVDYLGSSGGSFPLFLGISGGMLTSPAGTVPAGTQVPVSWDYTVTYPSGGSVSNEMVFFGASLTPSGGGLETASYTGTSFLGNRTGDGTLEFPNEVQFPTGGGYAMTFFLEWIPSGAEQQLVVDFGNNSLDINAIPEPVSAMFLWVAMMAGLMAKRRARWWPFGK